MCLNFFFPLYQEKKLNWVLDFLGFENEIVNYQSVEFEKKSSLDKSSFGEPTNFDFYFETVSGLKLHFEIKYAEAEFGFATNDEKHINKFNAIYKKHILNLAPEYQTIESFLKNYQICRNLIHIAEKSFVVFVFPFENKKINDQSVLAKDKIVNTDWQNHLKLVYWEDLVGAIEKRPTTGNLLQQWKDFREKYL